MVWPCNWWHTPPNQHGMLVGGRQHKTGLDQSLRCHLDTPTLISLADKRAQSVAASSMLLYQMQVNDSNLTSGNTARQKCLPNFPLQLRG